MLLYITRSDNMEKTWSNLTKKAKVLLNTKEISEFIKTGSYACAIETDKNNIYTGINIYSNDNMCISAEEQAITSMISNNEKNIIRIIVLNELEEYIIPSEKAINYIMKLNIDPEKIEVLIDENKIIKLKELLPDWYGTYKKS